MSNHDGSGDWLVFSNTTRLFRGLVRSAISFVILLLLFLIWYGFWVTYVPNGHMPYTFNKMASDMNSAVEIYPHAGYIVVTPWKKDVHEVDIRPAQVCMNANNRVLNCKLVRFNPYDEYVPGKPPDTTKRDGFNKFIEWHGVGAGDNGYIYEILKSYAFNVNDGRDCPFLIIVDDMRHRTALPVTPTLTNIGK